MKIKLEPLDSVADNFFNKSFNLTNFSISEKPDTECPLDFQDYFPLPMHLRHKEFLDDIENLEIFPDDTWVVTYPKSGTTFTQEAVWQICNGVILNECKTSLRERFPFLEYTVMPTNKTIPEKVAPLKRPRFIKSHLPVHFLPKKLWTVKPKIIFVLREPKDVAVSYYHHYKNLEGWLGTKNDFLQLFLDGKVIFGDWWLHTKSIWKLQEQPYVKLTYFEDLITNPREFLTNLAQFLDQTLTEEQLNKLCSHLEFKNMQKNRLVNNDNIVEFKRTELASTDPDFKFIRKGQIGSHKDEMPTKFIKLFNTKTKEEFSGIGITYTDGF